MMSPIDLYMVIMHIGGNEYIVKTLCIDKYAKYGFDLVAICT